MGIKFYKKSKFNTNKFLNFLVYASFSPVSFPFLLSDFLCVVAPDSLVSLSGTPLGGESKFGVVVGRSHKKKRSSLYLLVFLI